MKYAVIEHGGKQYIAREGDSFEVDRMQLEAGKPVEFKEVLLLVDGDKVQIGKPLVSGASVKGKIEQHTKGRKILVFKYKPKERYRRRIGHRQQYTQVRIESIGSRASKQVTEAADELKSAETTAEKPARRSTKSQPASTAKKSSAAAKKAPPAKAEASKTKPQSAKGTTKTPRSTSSGKQDK